MREYKYIVYVVRDDEPMYISDSILTDKTRAVENTRCDIVMRIGICESCPSRGAICHVLVQVSSREYAKYCPILFHDVIKPSNWSPVEIV